MGREKDQKQRTVLIVDDQPEVRKVLRHILERDGHYAVAEAPDTAEALAISERDPPDAMILDISMPGGPGFTMIPALRSMSAPTKVLVLSSHYGMDEEIRAMGADAFLPKTAAPKEVLATLESILAT